MHKIPGQAIDEHFLLRAARQLQRRRWLNVDCAIGAQSDRVHFYAPCRALWICVRTFVCTCVISVPLRGESRAEALCENSCR